MNAIPENDYRLYLMHHGIKGQKHGVRRADWYPIAAWEASKGIAGKVKDTISGIRSARDKKKKAKQRLANLEKAREIRKKALEEKKSFEEEKKRILSSGTPGEVLSIASRLTDKEIQDVTIRNRNLSSLREMEKTRLKEISDAEFNRKYGKIDKAMKHINKLGGYAGDVSTAVSNFDKFMTAIGIKKKDDSTNDKSKKKDESSQQKQSEDKKKKNNQNQSSGDQSYSQSVEDSYREDRSFNKKSQPKRSNVVDGEWSQVITPENIQTAITVAQRTMNAYDSVKASSKAVSNGMKLLESKNHAQLILDDPDRRRGG